MHKMSTQQNAAVSSFVMEEYTEQKIYKTNCIGSILLFTLEQLQMGTPCR